MSCGTLKMFLAYSGAVASPRRMPELFSSPDHIPPSMSRRLALPEMSYARLPSQYETTTRYEATQQYKTPSATSFIPLDTSSDLAMKLQGYKQEQIRQQPEPLVIQQPQVSSQKEQVNLPLLQLLFPAYFTPLQKKSLDDKILELTRKIEGEKQHLVFN